MEPATKSTLRDGHRIALLVVVFGLLAACQTPEPREAAAPEISDTIVIGYPSDLTSVNELVVRNNVLHTGLHYYMMFATLLEEQAGLSRRACDLETTAGSNLGRLRRRPGTHLPSTARCRVERRHADHRRRCSLDLVGAKASRHRMGSGRRQRLHSRRRGGRSTHGPVFISPTCTPTSWWMPSRV